MLTKDEAINELDDGIANVFNNTPKNIWSEILEELLMALNELKEAHDQANEL